MTPAGRLRHKVNVEQLVTGSPQQTPSGENDATWTTYLSDIWASVEPLRGRELFAAQEHHSEVTTTIRIRYREGVTNLMRVVFESRYYPILAIIDPHEEHREMHLLCSEGVAVS